MKIFFKLLIREIVYFRKNIALMLLVVCLGIASLSFVFEASTSIEYVIQRKNKEILGGDLELMSRFPIASDESQKVKEFFKSKRVEKESSKVSLFTMVRFGDQAKLSYLTALDSAPLYGKYEFESFEGKSRVPEKHSVWVSKELANLLEIKKGDKLKLGDEWFRVSAVLSKDPSQGMGVTLAGSKVYINSDDLYQTGLITKGSTVRYYYLFKTQQEISKEELLEFESKEKFNETIFLNTPDKVSARLEKTLDVVQKTLGVLSFASLALSLFAFLSLVKTMKPYLLKNDQVLKEIGLSSWFIFFLRGTIPVFLTFFSILFISIGVTIAEPLWSDYVEKILSMKIARNFSLQTMWLYLALVFSYISTFYLSYFNSIKLTKSFNFIFRAGLLVSLLTIIYLGYGNLIEGGGIFLISFLLVYGFKMIVSFLLRKLEEIDFKGFSIRHMCLYLTRNLAVTSWMITSLTFSIFLIFFLNQLDEGVGYNFGFDSQSNRPSHFVFDIQDEQKDEFEHDLKNIDVYIRDESPLIVSRFLSVNGVPLAKHLKNKLNKEKYLEVEKFSKRGANLSYREKMLESETIVNKISERKKKELEKEGHSLLSLEQRFSKRYALDLGDKLEFDVMGVTIVGTVSSIRKIDWLSFDPNFFIQFKNNLLEGAPKTWVSSLSVPKERTHQFYQVLGEKYPNISIVDVTDVLHRVLSIISLAFKAIYLINAIALFLGLILVFVMFYNQVRSRQKDYQILLNLGTSYDVIKKMIRSEFFLILIVSIVVSIVLSIILNSVVLKTLLDLDWFLSGLSYLLVSLILLIGSVGMIEMLIKTQMEVKSNKGI